MTAGLDSPALLIASKARCRTLKGWSLMSSTNLRERLVLPLRMDDRGTHILNVGNNYR